MNPIQKKTREENAAESHFIVNKEDVKYATEKSVKEQIVDKKYILKNVTEKPIKIEQKTESFLTNSAPDHARMNKNKFVSQSRSPKRGRVKENIQNIFSVEKEYSAP